MINKLIGLAAKFAIGKHLVSGIAWANDKAKGNRTEIIGATIGVVFVLGKIGVIPESAADGINAVLAPMLPVTLAEKFSKAKEIISNIAPTPAAPADEVKPA